MIIVKLCLPFLRLIFISLVLLLSACATNYKVDPTLVSKFKPEVTPSKEETFVYVIRGSNFVGGARGAWLAANKNVVADLSNGSHALIKLASGVNSMHMVQGLAGFGYVRIDNRPGDTVYLVIDYTNGKMREVEFDLGASMVMQTDRADDIGALRKNDAYDNLLANPSLLGFQVMKTSETSIKPNQDSAVINFYRMESLIGEVPFDIWSEDGYVGSTTAGTYFQLRVKPGKHTFLARSERYSILEADVQAGKEYFVEFDVDMGWNQAHVQLLPVDTTKSAKDILQWQNNAKLRVVDTNVTDLPEFQFRVNQAKEYLLAQYKKVKSGDVATRALNEKHALAK